MTGKPSYEELARKVEELEGIESRRIQAEKELRESEERFRSIFAQSLSGIEVYDANGKLIEINPAGLKIFGIADANAVRGFDLFEDPNVPLDARSRLERGEAVEFDAAFDFDLVKQQALYPTARAGQCFLNCHLTPLRAQDESVTGYLVHVQEVTDRKRAEAALRQSEERFRALFEQAKRMEAIGTLAGGIAHRFNNALTIITASLGLLEMKPYEPINPDLIQSIKDASAEMSNLTRQLLAYAGGGKIKDKMVPVGDFVRQNLALIEHTIKPSIFVETDLPPDIMPVKMDVAQMQMVFSSLMQNASEAIEGRGRIRIACRNLESASEEMKDFPGLMPGWYVRLDIGDSGKGMDESTKSRLFEPFFTTKFLGRGLGLPAVYGIVKNHRGWIYVDSEPGKGTTVRVYLPASVAGSEAR